ncbi:hypothetical protein MNBD_GAMMA24-712 [hydrothermal vent metagenome]|uniref:Transmembrane protein n=1 Tax=hydrothermal vent metagenome TaxID=652676 RepID=A0A3B1C449_9ZZZZ
MNYAALSLEQSPPLSVPIPYYLTAPLFSMIAAVILFWEGPGVLASRWTPSLLAVTHFLTLGFLAMVMFGSVQQILPVLMGSPVPRPQLVSRSIHALMSIGILFLCGGFLLNQALLFQGAVLFLGSGSGLFIAVVAYCLIRAQSGHATVTATALAISALAITVSLGLYLAAGYGWTAIPQSHLLTNLHLAWGLLGWVTLLIIGVSYQVIPMFHVTPDYPRPVTRWLSKLLSLGLAIWTIATLMFHEAPWTAGLAAVCLTIFALATLNLKRRRRRRLPDVTLNYWQLAAASLLAAVLCWTVEQMIPGLVIPPVLLGILLIVGFAMSAVSGMLHKIAPFIIWLQMNNQRKIQGRIQGKIPTMKQIIPETWARWQLRLHTTALGLLLGASLWPAVLTYPAALLLFLASALLWWNLASATRLYLRLLRPQPALS